MGPLVILRATFQQTQTELIKKYNEVNDIDKLE